MDFRARLQGELGRRIARNPRYSKRAFARTLGLHNSTLTRVLDGSRGLSRPLLRRIGARLGLSPVEVQAAQVAEDARKILNVITSPDFRPDCRWIAMKSGVELDDVNRALHWLIHERRLVMSCATRWTVTT